MVLMKKLFASLLILALLISSLFSLPAYGTPTASQPQDLPADPITVRNTRLETMLNTNFVYGSDFDSISAMLENAAVSLAIRREDKTVESRNLISFVYNMYGVDASVYADEGKTPLTPDGEYPLAPRGYTIYRHQITSVSENEDGTLTVYSHIEADTHDAGIKTYDGISVFKETADSIFGYYLLSSEILEAGLSADGALAA